MRQNPPLTCLLPIQVNCGALLDDTFYCRKWSVVLGAGITLIQDFVEISEPTIKSSVPLLLLLVQLYRQDQIIVLEVEVAGCPPDKNLCGHIKISSR